MIPKNAIVRLAAFSDASDIRWTVLGYEPAEDCYRLQAVKSGHRHTVERVILHAWLRRKQLVKEAPTV